VLIKEHPKWQTLLANFKITWLYISMLLLKSVIFSSLLLLIRFQVKILLYWLPIQYIYIFFLFGIMFIDMNFLRSPSTFKVYQLFQIHSYTRWLCFDMRTSCFWLLVRSEFTRTLVEHTYAHISNHRTHTATKVKQQQEEQRSYWLLW
jgi:hypothetical protein